MSQERDQKGELSKNEHTTQVGSPLQRPKQSPQDPASVPTLAAPSDSVVAGTADTVMAIQAASSTSPSVPSLPSGSSVGPPSASSLPIGSFVVGASALPIIAQEFYEISGEFARGGLGRILTARDRRLGR